MRFGRKKYLIIPLVLVFPLLSYLAEVQNSAKEWIGTGCQVDGSFVSRDSIISNPREQSVHIVPVNLKGEIAASLSKDFAFLFRWGYRKYAGTISVYNLEDRKWGKLYNGYDQTSLSIDLTLNGETYSTSGQIGNELEEQEVCVQDESLYLRQRERR